MRGRFADNLNGMRFGQLTVIGRGRDRIYISGEKPRIRPYWICKCDCGVVKEVRVSHLKSGKTISCGCAGRKHSAEAKVKHGQSHSRLYGVWCNMKNRCYNRNVRSYRHYGERGIKVCKIWLTNFSAFSEWAFSSGYDPIADYGKCTLDRIDVNGDYCPENCRWVDLKAQANNRRNNRKKT